MPFMRIRIFGHTLTGKTLSTQMLAILGIIIFASLIKYIRWSFREEVDIELGKFFKIVLKKLPESDFDNLIMRGKLLHRYRHTSADAQRIIKDIVEFGEKNFSPEGKEVLNDTVPLFIKERNKGFVHSRALSIKNVLNYSNYEIFRHYVLHSSENNNQKNYFKYFVSFMGDIILSIPVFLFIRHPSYPAIALNVFSVISGRPDQVYVV